jgi:hypothetical protein
VCWWDSDWGGGAVGLSDWAVRSNGAGVVAHVLAVIAFPAKEAGWWAGALSAWVCFQVATVEGVVGRVVGPAAMVADHGRGGSRAVSDHVAEPVASVTLGQGRAVVKFTGPTVGPEKCGGGAAYQFETSAVWVME